MSLASNVSTTSLVLTSSGSCGGGAAGTWIFSANTGILGATLINDKDSSAAVTYKGNAAYIDSENTNFPSAAVPVYASGIVQIAAPSSREVGFTITVPAGCTAYLILIK